MFENLWPFIYGSTLVCLGFAAYFWKATLYKVGLYFQAAQFLLFSRDSKWKITDVPDPDTLTTGTWERRKIIFIRHGESQWNETFNRGFNPIFFIPRVIYACLYELFLLCKGVRDSWFYDSSLSHLGLKQTAELHKAVLEGPEPDLQILAGKSGKKSIIVSSPLRRALSTALFGMYERIEATKEKVVLLPYLQEISRNMDTLCITPPGSQPIPSWIEAALTTVDMKKMYNERVDVTHYTRFKSVKCTGLERLLGFNQWAFTRPSDEVIICTGHSLWFRAFFNTFLGRSSKHVARTKKMRNCAVVSFDLLSNGSNFKIDESTITPVHLGWEK